MEEILISIIIPVYNGEKYLNQCMKSILGQSMKNYEVIIIDDGSQDDFYKKCKEFIKGKKRFKLIHQKNQGVSVARNLAISIAKGKWIYFLDIDDELEENALEYMEQYSKDKIDWLIMNYCKHVVGGEKKTCRLLSDGIKGIHIGKEEFPRLLNEELFMYPCAKLYRRDIIQKNQLTFPVGIKYGEDIRFNLEYFKYVNIYKVCQEPVMTYHIRQGEGAGSAYYEHSFEMQMDIDKEIIETECKFYHISGEAKQELNYYFFRQGINTAAAYLIIWKKLSFRYRCRQIREVLSDERFITFLEKEKQFGKIKKIDYLLLRKKKFITYYFIHYMYTKLKILLRKKNGY